jgi:hypothetical protein
MFILGNSVRQSIECMCGAVERESLDPRAVVIIPAQDD